MPATVVVPEGGSTVPVRVTTRATRRSTAVTLTAVAGGSVRTAELVVTVR